MSSPTTAPEPQATTGQIQAARAIRQGRRTPKASVIVPPILVFLIVIALWYVITYVFLTPDTRFLMPAPHDVVLAFFEPVNFTDIMAGLAQTAVVSLIGLVIAIVIGVAWGVAMSQAKWLERSLFPYAVILQSIPILALVPLIGFWFGYELNARVIVCVLIALFPMVSNTLFGLQSVAPGQRELFKLQGASRWVTLRKLEMPTALPAIFAGMRISAGLSVVGAIVGDFFFRRGTPGLGSLISVYQSRLQSPELFASIIVAALFGVFIFWVFGFIAKLAVGKWYNFAK